MIPTTDAQNPRPARSPVVAFLAEEHRDALDLVALGVRGNLGLAALFTGDTDAAERAFREELMLCRELVVLPIAFEGLRGLAAIAAVHGDGQRAAALLGAAAAHRYGERTDALDARFEAAFFEAALARHGAQAWSAAFRDGGALTFADAIAYALEQARS